MTDILTKSCFKVGIADPDSFLKSQVWHRSKTGSDPRNSSKRWYLLLNIIVTLAVPTIQQSAPAYLHSVPTGLLWWRQQNTHWGQKSRLNFET